MTKGQQLGEQGQREPKAATGTAELTLAGIASPSPFQYPTELSMHTSSLNRFRKGQQLGEQGQRDAKAATETGGALAGLAD